MALIQLPDWNSHPPPEDKSGQYFEITCRLLPAWQIALIASPMLLFSMWAIAWPIMVGIAITLCAMKMKVGISPMGIEGKGLLQRQMLFDRTIREWKDLHSVRIRRMKTPLSLLRRINPPNKAKGRLDKILQALIHEASWVDQGFLLLDFRSGGALAFPLAGISARQLEEFFVALSRWADPMTLNPEIISLQRDVLTGQPAMLDVSYTRMWEDSLRARFEVTNFVPLVGGKELRGGELTILMLLACGGMSSVYLAREQSGKRVVVKELVVPADKSGKSREKVEQMFAREAKLLAKLRHPKMASVLDHFVEQGRNYLVLDYVPGLTLRQHVNLKGVMKEAEVVAVAMQLAEMLVYLHGFAPPIVHRDITPDNLVLNDLDGQVYLIDFGAANEFVGNLTGTMIGKQSYIPPEQFRGKALPQSDIYSVGGTLHFLLTGKDPEPITASRPKQLNAAIGAALDELIAKCTEPEATDRMPSALELKEALSWISSGPTVAPMTGSKP